jgi:hypothetical protein
MSLAAGSRLGGKRIVVVMPVEWREAQQSQNHVVFLENFLR